MRRATMLRGRITEQRDGGIWNEVWELPPPPLLSWHPNPVNASHTIKFCSVEGASARLFPSLTSMACCVSPGELVLRATADVVCLSGERQEEHSFIKKKCSAIEAVECKVDKWLITSRNGMIHHFLKLSSLKNRLWRSISVFYSWSSCLLQSMNL